MNINLRKELPRANQQSSSHSHPPIIRLDVEHQNKKEEILEEIEKSEARSDQK